jgi:hypothetical protein
MWARLLLSLMLVCMPHTVLGWSDLGHKAISEAVQSNLEPATVKAIARIVGSGDELPVESLARLSLWPDQIQAFNKNTSGVISGFSPNELKEARTFIEAHPDNAVWHYVNLPLGSSHYPDTSHTDLHDPVLPFTDPHDIVHMIQRCIEILEAEPESPQFTRLQALRWLLHLVEDIHQPLHVASGYYSTVSNAMEHPQRIDDPIAVSQQQAKNDRGGNVLLFLTHPHCPTVRTQENLHSAWDSCLVDVVNGTKGCVGHSSPQDVTHLAGMLKTEAVSAGSERYKTGGDIHHWAEQWATDTLRVARARVFNIDLTDGCVIRSDKAPHDPLHVQSRIAKPHSKAHYLRSHKDVAKVQLTKAAVRLADLLNHIDWK